MRLTTTTTLLLPLLALASAQDQVPIFEKFSNWLDSAKQYYPNPVRSPGEAGSSGVGASTIHAIGTNNWQTVLAASQGGVDGGASAGFENWMVLVTGGNRTCGGQCGVVEAQFEESVAQLAAAGGPEAPRFGRLDCDAAAVLCTAWFASPPALWYVRLPVPGGGQHRGRAATDVHVRRLNASASTVAEMVDLHAKRAWRAEPKLEGALHPFDGWAALTNANMLMGYVLYALSFVPSWAMMLGVSFLTRTMMNRRIGTGRPQQQAGVPRGPASVPLGGAPAANEGYPASSK